MKAAGRGFAILAAVLMFGVLAGCTSTVDELIMNPNDKDEMILKLLKDPVAKEDIMDHLTSDDNDKVELALTLLGDTAVKTLAIEHLVNDRFAVENLVKQVAENDQTRAGVISVLAADPSFRIEMEQALKRLLPKK